MSTSTTTAGWIRRLLSGAPLATGLLISGCGADGGVPTSSIGRIACWGKNGGIVPAPTETGFLDMDLGTPDYLCAVRATGETMCYFPGYPEGYINTPWHAPLPGADYVRIANDGYRACAVRRDGTVACRGGYTR